MSQIAEKTNKIALHIHFKAGKDSVTVQSIIDAIREKTGWTKNKCTHVLNNNATPSISERIVIAQVLGLSDVDELDQLPK